jgi:hypothetical protein
VVILVLVGVFVEVEVGAFVVVEVVVPAGPTSSVRVEIREKLVPDNFKSLRNRVKYLNRV